MIGLVRTKQEKSPNALRYARAGGHVESYFLRANDPKAPRALWLKATILARLDAPPVAESWFIYFDGERHRTFAHRETQAFEAAELRDVPGDGLVTNIAGNRLELGATGTAEGAMRRDGVEARWKLRFARRTGPIAEPLTIFRRIAHLGPFPKAKTQTPFPALELSGELEIGGERVELDRWLGAQGHNWGQGHALEHAWAQCLFPATAQQPEAMLEGIGGRVKLGGRPTPRMSTLVIRRGDRTYRFDALFDFWRQDFERSFWRWRLGVSGADGQAELFVDAGDRPMVCLGYENPDREMRYCFNSKLARTRVRVRPRDGAPFELFSEHGGALELVLPAPHPDFPTVI